MSKCVLNQNKTLVDNFITNCKNALGTSEGTAICQNAHHHAGGEWNYKSAPTSSTHNACKELSESQCTALSNLTGDDADLAICINTDTNCSTDGYRCDRGFVEKCGAGMGCTGGNASMCDGITQYQDQPQQATCKNFTACDVGGKFVKTPGTATADQICDVCPAGTYQEAGVTSSTCAPCPAKSYQTETGQTTCQPVPVCPTDKPNLVFTDAATEPSCIANSSGCKADQTTDKGCLECLSGYTGGINDGGDGTCKAKDFVDSIEQLNSTDSKYPGADSTVVTPTVTTPTVTTPTVTTPTGTTPTPTPTGTTPTVTTPKPSGGTSCPSTCSRWVGAWCSSDADVTACTDCGGTCTQGSACTNSCTPSS